MKWYHKILSLGLLPVFRKEAEKLVLEQKAIAEKIIKEAHEEATRIKKGNPRVKLDQATEFVFESGGIKYYQFIGELNIPVERALTASDVYEEYSQRTDKIFHLAAYESILKCLNKGENIKAGLIASNALERMSHVTNAELIYKLASVLYFDENENPYEWDATYNEEKINHWKKEKDIYGFFLKLPLSDLLPSFNNSEMDFRSYTHHQTKELLSMWKLQLSELPESEKKKDMLSQVRSLERTHQELEKLER